MSSARAGKPASSRKSGTESTRRFTYKSFSQQISSLKTQPWRRVRSHGEDDEPVKSFFRSALESWVDLNLSANFVEFSRTVLPLSESLPLILHYQDRIFDTLVEYIEKRDPHSLEPLLDLLSHLAHDLGASFEPYFARSVQLLSGLVAKHVEVSIVEWTFGCLAYLFKYLYALLVPDLRPLYEVLAPLLGREQQKTFNIRFAAEALSFLVRKTKETPLRVIVKHAFEDLGRAAEKPAAAGYADGLMTMFTEACTGVERKLHTKAARIFGAMLSVCAELGDYDGPCFNVVQGTLTALIHHTTAESFEEILDVIYGFIDERLTAQNTVEEEVHMGMKLLYTCVAVRKSSRIRDMGRVGDTVLAVIDASARTSPVHEASRKTVWQALKTAAVVIQSAEPGIVLSKCSKVIDCARDFEDGLLFLPFCEFVATLDGDRFGTFVGPYFRRFAVSKWAAYEESLCLLIPKLSALGALKGAREPEPSADYLGPNAPIIQHAENAFRELSTTLAGAAVHTELVGRRTAIVWRYLDVILSLSAGGSSSYLEALRSSLQSLLQSTFERSEDASLAPVTGKALSVFTLLRAASPSRALPAQLSTAFVGYHKNPIFLKGVHDFLRSVGVSAFNQEEQKQLVDALITNLSNSRHDTRYLSLLCLQLLFAGTSSVIQTAVLLEEMPLTVDNQRNISMYIRRLGSEYAHLKQESWERLMVPYYCFGLLTVHFAPAWTDAAEALAKVAVANEGIVAELAFGWLVGKGFKDPVDALKPDSHASAHITRFECTNLKQLEEVSRKCVFGPEVKTALTSLYSNELDTGDISAALARQQAIRVLCEVPQLAEKRSRQLVPMFLQWTAAAVDDAALADETENATASTPTRSRKDQVGMLTLFSKFINPKVLYQSEAAYATLLNLLAIGDVKIQSLALKCVLTWKIPAVNTYADNLNNLLDDTRFRDELTHFVQVDEDESSIQIAHREALMPVLLRILYGRSLSRKHAASGKRGMSSTRTTILAALSNFRPEERAMFIEITLGNLANVQFVDKTDAESFKFNTAVLESAQVPTRKLVGYVRMVEDMLKQLGTTLSPNVTRILDALLYAITFSANGTKDKESSEPEGDESDPTSIKSLKPLRQGGLKCLIALFSYFPEYHWAPYMPSIFSWVVDPRLQKLPTETAQGVSGILQLFSTWAASRHTVLFLVGYNAQVLPQIANCLATEGVKDEVVLYVLQILRKVLALAEVSEAASDENARAVKDRLVRPAVDLLLERLAHILKQSPGKDVLEQAIETVSLLSPHVSGNTETTQFVELSVFLLDQPTRRVSPKSKSGILKTLVDFLPLCVLSKGDALYERAFRTVSSLFGFFRDRESRETLAVVLGMFAAKDPELEEVGVLSRQLNAFSTKRLDEPDFDQRLAAFASINNEAYARFSPQQWLPLVYNMLFYIKDREEHAIRINATSTLKRLIEVCGAKLGTPSENEYFPLLQDIVLPAIRAGVHERSEEIRKEYVEVMDHMVKTCRAWAEVSDLQPLLMGDDEEANFFNNILHVQTHRRLRALRRLAATVKKEPVHSANIAHFFLPLIEHFVFDPADDGHNLASEAVAAIGVLVVQLAWPQYRALLRRYVAYIKAKPEQEKIVIRLIGTAADALLQAATAVPEAARETVDGDGDTTMENAPRTNLADTLPARAKLADDIAKTFLPALTDFLHHKDESTVSLRIPVAVSIVKLLKILPDDQLRAKLPGVLTDVCHILRSRAQESRDLTRRTLSEIALLLGPQYFSFIIKELRGALLRGYQLHVLSFTLHALLVAVLPAFVPGDLDHCAPAIVHVVMDDIFGTVGAEKDAEGYTNKMKEVKSSKSYDTMEILASITTLPHLSRLIQPVKALLQENLNFKLVHKIDELLRRLTAGIMRNGAVGEQGLLVFCYQVVQESYKLDQPSAAPSDEFESLAQANRKKYLVNLRVPSKTPSATATSSHFFKLARFALDVLRTVLTKHEHLRTPENVAGLIPVIGDNILSVHEETQISSLRLLTTLIRVPLADIGAGAPVFVSKALAFVKASPTTNSELAQASLKLLAAILRDRHAVPVKETSIAYLLSRLKSDIEQPDRQGVAFTFIKAVLARKVLVPEVYEVLDRVAAVMVTNQTRSTRDLARGVYWTFLLEYPQGKERWRKQLAFLLKNLEYAHAEGRQSVLEAVHLLVTKIGDGLVQDVLETFFVPLVLRLVNDDSAECREMAGALIKHVLERADAERLRGFLALARTWLGQDERAVLARVALQVYALWLDASNSTGTAVDPKKEMPALAGRLRQILLRYAGAGNEDEMEEEDQWEMVYFALQLWGRLVRCYPETALAADQQQTWGAVVHAVKYPHAWVSLSAAKLLGLLFAACNGVGLREESKAELESEEKEEEEEEGEENGKSRPERTSETAGGGGEKDALATLPLETGHGLQLHGETLIRCARTALAGLWREELAEEMGLQTVKNLLFLARCFCASNLLLSPPNTTSNTTSNATTSRLPSKVEVEIEEEEEDEEEDEEEEEEEERDEKKKKEPLTALLWLLTRVSALLRSERKPLLQSKAHALRFLAAAVQVLDPSVLAQPRVADTMIRPLFVLVEAAESVKTGDLQTTSRETLHLLQSKLGTTEYSAAYTRVRSGVFARRGERRLKRSILAVAEPEKAARRKSRKHERSRSSKKERSRGFREARRGRA